MTAVRNRADGGDGEERERPDGRSHPTWLPAALLVATVLTLGFNWPLLAIGLEEISPLWLSTMRLAGATVIIFGVAASRGRLRRPPGADLPVLVSVAFGRLIMVMVLVFIALRFVPPGRSSVLVWTSSLWTVPMAVAVLGEHMNARRWVGLGLGIAGIVVMVEPWEAAIGAQVLVGYGLLMAAAVFQAATAVHVRHHRWLSTPIELLPWQLVAAVVPLLAVTWALEGMPSIAWRPGLVAIVVYQGALATGFALWAQLTVLRLLPAITTNLSLMMVPVLGFASSVVVVGERVTVPALVATVLIGAGVLLGVGLGRVPASPPPLR
jgi:drug/metabolite transporter (DMT)-like permease